MQKIKNFKTDIIRLKIRKGELKIRKRKNVDPSNFAGIYEDMIKNLGVDATKKIHKYYQGQQVTFPVKLYSKKYVLKRLGEKGVDIKELSRELGYSERWLRHLSESIK